MQAIKTKGTLNWYVSPYRVGKPSDPVKRSFPRFDSAGVPRNSNYFTGLHRFSVDSLELYNNKKKDEKINYTQINKNIMLCNTKFLNPLHTSRVNATLLAINRHCSSLLIHTYFLVNRINNSLLYTNRHYSTFLDNSTVDHRFMN